MPVVADALQRGQHVSMTVSGGSMIPFIHDGDSVELAPLDSPLACGDIVLAQAAPGCYVLHRVVRLAEKGVWLRGDAQRHSAGPMPPQVVLARALTASRKGRVRTLSRGWWLVAGLVWVGPSPFAVSVLQLATGVRRAVRRLLREGLTFGKKI
jgi:hypothetical protein